jgi:phosphinothricin acetyltransferase
MQELVSRRGELGKGETPHLNSPILERGCFMIRPVKPADASAIAGIYNYYINNTVITFEEIPVSINEMGERIRMVSKKYPWLVWEDDGEVKGYAYVNTWKDRSSYRFSAEISIYVKIGSQRKGIGGELFGRLLEEARKTTIHTLVSGITLPNDASTTLHEKFGFKRIAVFHEVGFKFSQWLDVGYWELALQPADKEGSL